MRADAQRNYARLLDAASAAFLEHGADDVSLEEIARRAGVGIGTLYRHFPTRQALLEAVYRDQVELLEARAEELLKAESPGDALADWLRALMKFSSTKHSLTSALLATLGKDSELLSSCGAADPRRGRCPARPGPGGGRGAPRRRLRGRDPAGARGQHRHAARHRPTRARPTGCWPSSWTACAPSPAPGARADPSAARGCPARANGVTVRVCGSR